MKARKTLIALMVTAVCACAGAFAVACAAEEDPTYTVNFNVKGHGTAPQAITGIESGSLIEKPVDPEEEGYVFYGWYKDFNCTDDWDFATDTVTSDYTLFALWDTVKYTFTFDANDHGVAPEAVTNVEAGDTVQKPDDPAADGFVFEGWYKDDGCTEVWDFATDTVSGDTTVYAGWKQIYPVAYGTPFSHAVDGSEYFSVAQSGNYSLNVAVDGGAEGDTVDVKLDGETNIAVLNDRGAWQETFFLEKGLHKLESVTEAFNGRVTLEGLDMPFTDVMEYYGDNYQLSVAALGVDSNNVKFSVPSIRFGEGSLDSAQAIDFDGECYTLNVRERNGGIYEYYQVKIRINISGGRAVTVDVFTKTGDTWNTESADLLEPARTAAEVAVYLNINGENTVSVPKTFEYVYFMVNDNKYKWLVFSGIAEGTEFYWVDVNTSRTGDRGNAFYIQNNDNEGDDAIRLFDFDEMYNYCAYIAVKPAPGQTSVSFTVREGSEPAPKPGTSADNPAVLVVNEPCVIDKCKAGSTFYFTFTPEEAGKYIMKVYSENEYGKYKASQCAVVGNIFDYLPFTMPSVDDLLNGKEVNLTEKAYNFSVLLAVDSNLTVSFEKEEVVSGGIPAGTYSGSVTGSRFVDEFTFVFDDSNNVAITQIKKLASNGNVLGTYNCESKQLMEKSDGTYGLADEDDVFRLGSNYAFVFTLTADGSLNVSGSGVSFTATLQ